MLMQQRKKYAREYSVKGNTNFFAFVAIRRMRMDLVVVLAMALLFAASSPVSGDGVTVQAWGHRGALLYTLRRGGMTMSVTDWGATVTSLRLPDSKTGKDVDIVLGYDSLEPYTGGTPYYFGAIVGRVANRIKNARFVLNGTTNFLTANDHNNTLHGGFIGYNAMFWRSRILPSSETPAVQFLLYSYNTEQGFPGDVDISVTYSLQADYVMRIDMEAVPLNKETPINLAHHSYWNLGGQGSGSILNHSVQIMASHYTPVDGQLIPTGDIATVMNTPFDFRRSTSIGSRISSVPGGYDHNFALDKTVKNSEGLYLDVKIRDPVSGRQMEVWSNQVGLQFYTGNFIDHVVGKAGFVYQKHGAFCIETQGFPNAINEPRFPSTVVKQGQLYKHTMVHKFHV